MSPLKRKNTENNEKKEEKKRIKRGILLK